MKYNALNMRRLILKDAYLIFFVPKFSYSLKN